MLDLRLSTKFKKDYARCRKRQYDMEILQAVVGVLRVPAPLPPHEHIHSAVTGLAAVNAI